MLLLDKLFSTKFITQKTAHLTKFFACGSVPEIGVMHQIGVSTLLMKSQDTVHDLNLGQLYELLKIIDTKLFEINECISKSVDPESDFFFDRGETDWNESR